MIAYEDLVSALTSWRARNGLPTTPPDYGEPAPIVGGDSGVPADVYDLSEDSGLIMTEDVMAAEEASEYGDPSEDGGIETAMEISAEEHARGDDFDDPPGTDAYYQADGEASPYDDVPGYSDVEDVATGDVQEILDSAPAGDAVMLEDTPESYGDDGYGDEATAIGGADYGDVPPPMDGTLDASPVDVIEEEPIEEELLDGGQLDEVALDEAPVGYVDEVDALDEDVPLDAAADDEADLLPPMDDVVDAMDDEVSDDATMVAADPSDVAEPEALPPIGDDDDDPRY